MIAVALPKLPELRTAGFLDGDPAIREGAALDVGEHLLHHAARLGGDEFVILTTDVSACELDGILGRLRENFRRYNEQGNHSYRLALSIGVVRMEHNTDSTIEELIARADLAMYEDKRSKNRCFGPADARSHAA